MNRPAPLVEERGEVRPDALSDESIMIVDVHRVAVDIRGRCLLQTVVAIGDSRRVGEVELRPVLRLIACDTELGRKVARVQLIADELNFLGEQSVRRAASVF